LVRAICHLRQAYSREEMARPFIVVRTELAPDFADPETRRALAAKAISSGAEIFGPADAERPLLHVSKTEVLEDLASEPDFTDAEVHAEEAADDVDTSLPITDPIAPDDLGIDALKEAVAEPAAAELPDEPAPAPTPAAGACDDCGGSLTPAVVAYCQSPRGQATFSGANYCFTCQKKHRPAKKAVAQ
jgi:hypothetical protein